MADPPTVRRLEVGLNRYRNACGCTAGSVGLLAVGVVCLLSGSTWIAAIGYAFAGALAGKLLGVLFGRWAFRVWLARTAELYASGQPQHD